MASSSRPSTASEMPACAFVSPLAFPAPMADLLDPARCCLKERDDWMGCGRVVCAGCKRVGCANVVNVEEG